ncbi:MAG: GGDEF domain-containing protein [Archangiaceae bacterium]|nr:GGDEF domain-containing protein [Archangiaceae bacterium]
MRSDFPTDSPLHAFTEDETEAIFAAGKERTCGAGEAIIIEGEPGDSMYFLLEGSAEARFDGGAKVRTYGPGSYFGELSFINPGQRRSTTIVATSAARLQVLDQGSVRSLLASHPHVIFTLLQRACAFLVDNERALIADLRRRNTELQQTIKKLEFTRHRLSQEEETARTDALSGLYNRRGFDAELPSFIERARALGSGLVVLALDLDHFKPLNDTAGHAAGDFVLRAVGKLLREKVRKSDLPCRIGGDEFVVLLADVTETVASMRAESIRVAIGELAHPGNEQGIRITSTVGATLYRAGETKEELMHRADEALYAAKRAGRNRVAWK